jgi:hypothetical protein
VSEPQQPQNGRLLTWLNAVKGLTFTNVLVIGMLVVIAIPTYTLWKALGDDKLLDRFLSTYEELSSQNSGCTVRHMQARGGPDIWGISSGFAYQGEGRWLVSVALPAEPSIEEIMSYCESLKLIADKMLDRSSDGSNNDATINSGENDQIHSRPMQSPPTDGR